VRAFTVIGDVAMASSLAGTATAATAAVIGSRATARITMLRITTAMKRIDALGALLDVLSGAAATK
jgi:hypothetical protein